MHTPHNIGFAVIDELARRFDFSLRRSFRFSVRMATGIINDHKVTLAKPDVFMNTCGPVVAALANRRGFSADELIIITDDANLPEGQLRIRPKGSSGGHKGMQSIIDHLGHDNFARVRLGIGPARDGSNNLVEHVLKPFPAEIRTKIEKVIYDAAEAVVHLLKNGIEAAMNRFNKPNQEVLP